MYKLYKRLKSTTLLSFELKSSYLFDRKEGLVYKTEDFNNRIWEIKSICGSILQAKNNILLISNDDETYFINDITGEIITTIDFSVLGSFLEDDNSYQFYGYGNLQFEGSSFFRDLGLINTDKKEFNVIKRKYEFEDFKILNGGIYILDKTNILFLDKFLNTLWKYSITDFPNYLDILDRDTTTDIKQVIGIYNNLIWVLLGGHRLIAINIENGKLKHCIENIQKGYGDIHLDINNGVLKILAAHSYSEFDMNELTLNEKLVNESYFFRDSSFYEGDDNLYFCGITNFPKVSVPNSFGVFDTKICRVAWLKEQREDWGLFYNPPKAHKNGLAIFDDKGNLLVFNKEELKIQSVT